MRAALPLAAQREPALEKLSDEDLTARAVALRADLAATPPAKKDQPAARELRAEMCALGREAARRALDQRAYDEQLLGAQALLGGHVVEMATGEGKTLTAAIAAAGLAAAGRVHVLTVNDYLARRDAEWMGPVYRLLGLSVGWVTEMCTPADRRVAYAKDVTYVSVNEAGFDFLRDGQATDVSERVQGELSTVVVDEADSILIDEARVPLVLAGTMPDTYKVPEAIAGLIRELRPDEDYVAGDDGRAAHLTTEGLNAVEDALGGIDLYATENLELLTAVNVALHAEALLRRDVDYIIRDGKVELVDEFRGRVAQRRRWPDGLQAAVEAKEELAGTGTGTVLATVTVQAFISRYAKVCGMTGTAVPVGDQLREFYDLEVAVVPPHKPCIRVDQPDRIYATRAEKVAAIVTEISGAHASGRPVLVGTLDVAESEQLAATLRATGVECVVLNAKSDAKEAAIIAEAGAYGAVTVSTQITGRGVDIRLGGSDEKDHDRVAKLGGLYVIGTGRHDSRRVDDQLRGRAGRQGDPGESVFLVSMEDPLVTRYGPEPLPTAHPHPDGRVDTAAVLRAVASAQRVAEQVNLEIHRNTWRYHVLLEKQRQIMAEDRERMLTTDEPATLLARLRPEKYEALVEANGAGTMAKAARAIVLFHLDMCWSEHLDAMADLREGIHLRALGNQDPLDEFHREAIPAFKALMPLIEERSAATLDEVESVGPDWTPSDAGLVRPSATWTYVVNDNPFGSELDRLISAVSRRLGGRRRG